MGEQELRTIRSRPQRARIAARLCAPLFAPFAAFALGCATEARPPEVPANVPVDPQLSADPQLTDNGAAVSVDDFTEPLSRYGTWIDDPRYGRVWKPSDESAGPGFTPYASDGTWAANDDGGWVFQSSRDPEWGWATYHYGRWVELDGLWVWVPGTVWGPSWVEWRYGGGYVGWAPMGPPGVVMGENRWVFVEERRFTERGVVGFRLPPERVHAAFVAAAPIVEVHGAAHWTVGPPAGQLRAAGAQVHAVHATPEARGSLGRGPAASPGAQIAHPPVQPVVAPPASNPATHGVRPAPVPGLPPATSAPRGPVPVVVAPKPKPKPLPVPPPPPPKPRLPTAPHHR
jgi:hypothetical protein